MSVIGDFLSTGLSTIIKPITDVLNKKQERKIAKDTINGQIAMARQAGEQEVIVNDQHLDQILAQNTTSTWKDEYATVSIISIVNFLMIGGILNGFGYPAFLEGTIIGVRALAEVLQNGGDLAFIVKATVLVAIGLNVWRKF